MARSYEAVEGVLLPLGRRGENEALEVRVNIKQWIADYGNGAFGGISQRYGEDEPYPVTITVDGDYACWLVTDVDTAIEGYGKFELDYIVGGVLAKSVVWRTKVQPSVAEPGPVPDPYESWVEDVLAAGASVLNKIDKVAGATAGNLPEFTADGSLADSGIAAQKINYLESHFEAYKINQPLDEFNQPTDGTDGQILRTNGNGSTEWVDVGLPTDEQTAQAVSDWLDDHPEATTTVQDGSLTEDKFSTALKLATIKDYVTPEMFGAVGDGVTDDTDAWEDAIASNKVIYAVNEYLITRQVQLQNDVFMVGDNARFVCNTGSAVLIEGAKKHTYSIAVHAASQSNNDYVGVEVRNCNNCVFEFRSIRNFKYGLKLIGTTGGGGCCSNQVSRAFIQNAKYFISVIDADGSATSAWANENYFQNVRLLGESNTLFKGADYGISLDAVNSNHFFDVCAEDSYCAVLITNGSRENTVENIRTEHCTYAAKIINGSVYNVVDISYTSDGVASSVENSCNVVRTLMAYTRQSDIVPVATTGNLKGKVASTLVGSVNQATADRLYSVDASNNIIEYVPRAQANTDGIESHVNSGRFAVGFMIDVSNDQGKELRARALALTADARLIVKPYDSSGNFVTDADIYGAAGKFSYVEDIYVGNFYTNGRAYLIDLEPMRFVSPAIKKVFVGIMPNKNCILQRVDVFGSVYNSVLYDSVGSVLPAAPTSGGYYIGQTVYSSTEAKKWVWNGTSWTESTI